MASYTRTLQEDLTVQDFLLSKSSLSLGAMSVKAIFSQTNIIGANSNQQIQKFDTAGPFSAIPQIVQEFPPEGRGSFYKFQKFDVIGELSGGALQVYDVAGKEFYSLFGLNIDQPLAETLSFADSVDIQGDFTRALLEILTLTARTGASKGLFFRADQSTVVTGNTQVRQLEEIPDSGEIAASERPISGDLRILRYVPGTTPGSPNQVDLGSVPTDVGSQGFLFDNSPQGVFLRGTWDVKLIVQDTHNTGQVKAHVSLFVVTADAGGVAKVQQIGPTKTSTPFTPSTIPTQLTFQWAVPEVGEIFIDNNQYMYVETFIEELSHPAALAAAKLRLSDIPQTLFSELRYPGVSDETTYYLTAPPETLSVSDSLAYIHGFNRALAEALSVADSMTHYVDFERNLSESLSFSDLVKAAINVLYETLSITDSMTRTVSYQRAFIETLSVIDSVLAYSNSAKNLVETLNVQDYVNFSIGRPQQPRPFQNINKRPLDSLKRKRFRSLK